jgi:hypothetical protein
VKGLHGVSAQNHAILLVLRPVALDRCVGKDDFSPLKPGGGGSRSPRCVLLEQGGFAARDSAWNLRLSKRLRSDLIFLSTHHVCSVQMATVNDYEAGSPATS